MSNDLSSQQTFLSSSNYDLRITNLARFICRLLPVKCGKLIDIGAGNGLFLRFFKTRGFDVSGVELEKNQVHEMKQNILLKDVDIQQGDITKLKGKENYDVVIASDVIEHIKDDTNALVNLYSFIKEDGYLVITVPAHSFLFGKRDVRWGHYRRYDKNHLKSKISELGEEIVAFAYWNFLGFFAYFFFEKILHFPIREEFRYKKSFTSSIIRKILDFELKIEEIFGGVPIGLTLVAVVKKSK